MIYNLERFNILVVEDNHFMKSLVVGALTSLGVGTIKTASEGGEAVDLLRLMSADPMRAGMLSIDIVLTNWQMEPVDGLKLLRWIRQGKDSPDKFLPVIMVSGSADKQALMAARDQGVTEFLAKPFSGKTVLDRVRSVIERPRQFVKTGDYFGPDRRRQDQLFVGNEKRIAGDTEVVYNDD